jgi:CheY-like chemotaxis protein
MKKKILLVDDSNFFLEIEKDIFSRADCDIITAKSGKEALEQVRSQQPDIVLMDLYMQDMKGNECCAVIKADPELKDIPVIIVTHSISSEDKSLCIEAGCDDYVVKPVSKTTILGRVEKFIDINVVGGHKKAPISAEVVYVANKQPHKGYAYVISEDDMYMKGDHLSPVGTTVNIIFSIAGIGENIAAECEVLWTTEGRDDLHTQIIPGMAMKFKKISPEDAEAIATYVDLVNSIFNNS